jgi:CHASE2 domain-containing sensor protein
MYLVIAAGIAGNQGTGMVKIHMVIFAVCFGIAIHGFWIPAIPAGKNALKNTCV